MDDRIDSLKPWIIDKILELSAMIPGGPFTPGAVMTVIAGGGSDRSFVRISDGGISAVALVQPGGGGEFESYIGIGRFLSSSEIPVPQFYSSDNKAGILLMEDLGDKSMETALEEAGPDEELSFYRESIDILFRLQTAVTSRMRQDGLLKGKVFGRDVLLSETDYFSREFAGRYCDIPLPSEWDRERELLAEKLASIPLSFMHRDFQSRNILVCGGSLRLIDFQTAHRGPGLYDAASLLKDPYHPVLPGTRRTLLMELYYRLREAGESPGDSFDEYYDTFLLAGIQRNLQALAAFAYLGLVKGKKDFLDSIPAGIDLLEEGIDEAGGFPVLKGFTGKARDIVRKKKDQAS